MVLTQEIVHPGRGLPQFPVARGHNILPDSVFSMRGFQPLIGAYPDALFFIRINLAPTFEATSAGSVALALGTLTHRAQIPHIKYGAVTAVLAAVKAHLNSVFKSMEGFFKALVLIHKTHQILHRFE